MGVVYFSIIPTFEPSRYCKCWIVCFYNKIILQMESENKEWGRSREMRTKIQDTWDI